MKKIWFIINPRSGTSKKIGLESLIAKHIDRHRYSFEIYNTEYAGHAQEIATRSIESKVDIVVACGGDGTVNEIAKALIGTELILAVLPLGSGNGFAAHIKMPSKIIDAINHINTAKTLRIDTGKVNDKIFVNVAGIGFDGLISYRIKTGKTRGLWMYLKTAFKEMWNYKPIHLDIKINGKPFKEKLATIAIANGSIYGNNFQVAPGADFADGQFEVIMIKNARLFQYLLQAYRFLNGSLYRSSLVTHLQSTEIEIINTGLLYYHVDGEGLCTKENIRVSIHPSSLNVLVGKDYKIE